MKLETFVRIGKHHVNNCEDAGGNFPIGSNTYLLAVSDGCSMGNESHFASTLFIKLLREIAKEYFHLEFAKGHTPEVKYLLKLVVENLFGKIKSIKSLASFDKYDLLATLIIAIVDVQENAYAVITIGDGVVGIDDQIIDFDQNNEPDYIGYHIEKEFSVWYESQIQTSYGSFVKSISLSTDGIFTFSKKFDKGTSAMEQTRIIRNLLIDGDVAEVNELQKKVDALHQGNGLQTNDDIAVTRLIK